MLQRPRRRCEGTAMGAIVLDLRPGLGIGPFTIGMPICEAFAQIEQEPNIYDVVHVKYYDEEPLKLDIVISFPDHGFHLRFDPWSQRLRLVEIFDIKRLQMRYATSLIGGPSTLATFVAVYALFGPTFPGIYDKDRGVYTLFYPGLSFAFPIPSQYTDCCHDREAELPLEFPDGTTPVTCRVSIYDSSTDKKVGVGSLMDKASAPPLPVGSLYMEEVHVKLGEELYFTVGGQNIPFGASPQASFDVWTELGRPCGIHQKQVDQMVIHSGLDTRPRTTLCGDYFYNYFTRGLDILFDGQTHKIKKFVLHTNYPGHADFNSYIKCNFVIFASDLGGSYQDVNNCKHKITPSTKWEQVKEFLGDCGRAAIQTQGSTSNPFGSTFVYGYQNAAFETATTLLLPAQSTAKTQSTPPSPAPSSFTIRHQSTPNMTSVSGLTGSPSRCCFQIPARSSGSLRGQVSNFPHSWKPAGKNELLCVERSYWTGFARRLSARKTHLIKFAMDESYSDMSNEPTAIFPRINVRDPYKRLGISREASEDEIQGARNFLIRQYAGHKPSVDAIESAHDKIIMQQFYDRKNPKIDFKKKYREVNQSRVVQAVRNRFRTPSTKFIIKTSIAFVVLGALTVLFPTEEGPTLQVALSLLATIYFVYDRLKSKLRAFLYSAGSFALSWLLGTFLMVSVVPPLLKGPRSFEVTTSLITYVLLWVSSTYLK
ncbi:hypothetical protein C1H46_006296 [Malus baccata]|uniref:Uncharacterized protein n=1 Tax=Malus baccata TaxID=106549 RepID=A0A540NAG0_MALBA|nr:hypothetical protein C1H46_006296 [Malus baccata]